ncbi:MAG: hypothetical protein Q8J68_13100 [Methanolobus sp.]|uniref:hypothetical protein n=1 Tax=Methanolobus sp. TaxID=1874737 RepID=UPI00272F5C99|nr:hypothetical protein [Methanolobus sp.]MDP2218209.1 hypothetical protein [Methanolobus sp.]
MTRMKCLFPRPEENEEIPIQFIDMQQKLAGWSPRLKRSVYVDDFKDTEGLKRVRDVTLLRVYNWFLEGESLIELSEMEKSQFECIMDMFIRHGGEIRYTRKKVGERLINYFLLEEGRISQKSVKARLFSDLL